MKVTVALSVLAALWPFASAFAAPKASSDLDQARCAVHLAALKSATFPPGQGFGLVVVDGRGVRRDPPEVIANREEARLAAAWPNLPETARREIAGSFAANVEGRYAPKCDWASAGLPVAPRMANGLGGLILMIPDFSADKRFAVSTFVVIRPSSLGGGSRTYNCLLENGGDGWAVRDCKANDL